MITILHNIERVPGEVISNFEKIEVGQITRAQAIEYLTYLAHTENKMTLIKQELATTTAD